MQGQPDRTPGAGKPHQNGKDAMRRLGGRKTPERARQDEVDLDLMQRVAANQETAVAELYDRFGSLVYRMSTQSMPTRSEAEDAVQEVFIRLWKTAERFDPTRAALVTWVMLITRRHLVDRLRRKRARIKPTMLDEQFSGAAKRKIKSVGRMEQQEQYSELLERIDTLPELQQTVIRRAYLGGQTLRQISEELKIPLGTIKSALSRALVRLRERSGEELTT